MAKSRSGGVFLIVCGGLLLSICANGFLDVIEQSIVTEEKIVMNILFGLVGILLLWRGIEKVRKNTPKSS